MVLDGRVSRGDRSAGRESLPSLQNLLMRLTSSRGVSLRTGGLVDWFGTVNVLCGEDGKAEQAQQLSLAIGGSTGGEGTARR